MRKHVRAWVAAAIAAACGIGAPASATEFVVNGSFEHSTWADNPSSNQYWAYFQGGFGIGNGVANDNNYNSSNTNVNNPFGQNFLTGWDVSGYNFMYAPGQASNANGGVGSGNGQGGLTVWDLENTSPDGGYFIGADGGFDGTVDYSGPISQVINGLTIGQQYDVSFYWAAGQQFGPAYNGDTTEKWDVSLFNTVDGWSETQSTAVWTNPSHSFKPWEQVTFTFTAQSTSATLQFLALGTPNGQPPFSFLDGVSMVEHVPEPQTWAMMMIGFALIGGVMRTRRQQPTSGRRVLNSQIV